MRNPSISQWLGEQTSYNEIHTGVRKHRELLCGTLHEFHLVDTLLGYCKSGSVDHRFTWVDANNPLEGCQLNSRLTWQQSVPWTLDIFTERTGSTSEVYREVPPSTLSLLVVPESCVEQLARVRWPKERISRGVEGRFRERRHRGCSALPSIPQPFNMDSCRGFRRELPPRVRRALFPCHGVTHALSPVLRNLDVADASVIAQQRLTPFPCLTLPYNASGHPYCSDIRPGAVLQASQYAHFARRSRRNRM